LGEYKSKIRVFFSRFFKTDGLGDKDDIFAGGYVNSLFAMQLIAWLEKDFNIAVEDGDLKISNFNSVDAIAALIVRKKPAGMLA